MSNIDSLIKALIPKDGDERTPEQKAASEAFLKLLRLQDQVKTLLSETYSFRWHDEGWQGHFKSGQNWNLIERVETKTGDGVHVSHVVGPSRYGGNFLKDRIFNEVMGFSSDLTEEECEKILNNVELTEPVVLGSSYSLKCPYCGVEPKVGWDGHFLLIADPCPRPDGIPVTEFELNVPSGKIVMDDDLRTWFPYNGKDRDINGTLGIHLQILDYAEKAGFACGFVGNCSPGVFQDPENPAKLRIGNWPEEIRNPATPDEYDYIENPEKCPWGEEVGSICTDLWWYSIADYDDFKRRFEHYTPEEDFEGWFDHWTHHVTDVKPGVYRFRHYNEVRDDSGFQLYAEFEWVRDPDPVRDIVGEDASRDYNAVECLIQKCFEWPSLYMPKAGEGFDDRKAWTDLTLPQKLAALARAADATMCVLGGGIEWHPNGFPRTEVSVEASQLAVEFAEETGMEVGVVPPLTDVSWMEAVREDREEEWGDFLTDPEKSWHWYPFSAGYGGFCLGAGVGNDYSPLKEGYHLPLNRSHVLLALNIAQNAIRFPEKPRLNTHVYPPTWGRKEVRGRMQLALKVYRAYRELYPDLVMDEKFDDWASSPEADSWIDAYDLGPEHPPVENWPKKPKAFELSALGGFVEFDAAKLEGEGRWCWHPHNPGVAGCWASKENAQRYALQTKSDEGDFWTGNAGTSVPLHFVGRVVQGKVEGQPVLEVDFDFGTPQMVGPNRKRFALRAEDLKEGAFRHFTDEEEYNRLLPIVKTEFEAAEKVIRGLIQAQHEKYPPHLIPTGSLAYVMRENFMGSGDEVHPVKGSFGPVVEVEGTPEFHQVVEFPSGVKLTDGSTYEGDEPLRVTLPCECITLYTPG